MRAESVCVPRTRSFLAGLLHAYTKTEEKTRQKYEKANRYVKRCRGQLYLPVDVRDTNQQNFDDDGLVVERMQPEKTTTKTIRLRCEIVIGRSHSRADGGEKRHPDVDGRYVLRQREHHVAEHHAVQPCNSAARKQRSARGRKGSASSRRKSLRREGALLRRKTCTPSRQLGPACTRMVVILIQHDNEIKAS